MSTLPLNAEVSVTLRIDSKEGGRYAKISTDGYDAKVISGDRAKQNTVEALTSELNQAKEKQRKLKEKTEEALARLKALKSQLE